MREEQYTLTSKASEASRECTYTTCCIVGAGPAGAILALLLARQGIEVTLLESHGDFDRQFRGDSIYPTVMEMMADLGLSEGLHAIPHTKIDRIPIEMEQGELTPINMRYIKSQYPYIMLVPQVDFLEFITAEASRYPNFRLVMNAPVRELLEEDGCIRGVRYRAPDGWYEVRANLTVGADGRFSKVRSLAHIPVHRTEAAMDNIWFRLPRQPGDPEASFGRMTSKTMVAMLMRTDHWQITCNIAKGSYAHIRAQGLPAFRRFITEVIPILEERMEQITEWNQLSLLSVEMGHISCWYRPGLLLIGDAAHIISPSLGAGINLAIQDAIVAANVLTHPLQRVQQHGQALPLRTLAEVQLRRFIPMSLMLRIQRTTSGKQGVSFLKESVGPLFAKYPILQRTLLHMISPVMTRVVTLGIWRTRVRYRQAHMNTMTSDAHVAVTDS